LINFVSNLPFDLRSGGFSAMNAAAHQALSKAEAINYVGPINPQPIFWQKATSKLLRVMGSQGDFFFFSRGRLQMIKEKVQAGCKADARLDFFHGFTPWIMTTPPRPYIAWSDCIFHDYIEIYHQHKLFRPTDLDRIEQLEASWLNNACRIGFSSNWAARRAVKYYGLNAARVHTVGNFGEVTLPEIDAYSGIKQFVFISTNFDAKGGPIVLSAFRKVRSRYHDAMLVIVGATPSEGKNEPGVIVTGFLRKEDPEQDSVLRQILGQSLALVHPTSSDISPLVVIEAAYFGCPAIASDRFAIPELVEHGVTGLLLNDVSADEVADAMSHLIEHDTEYRMMRRRAWTRARQQNSKQAFEQRMQALLNAVNE
jgi:glycosyltransferase involved in cell wall biosynthesis